jgi:hypothetical protein
MSQEIHGLIMQGERERLMKGGFRDWSRKDFRSLVAAIERNGRKERVSIETTLRTSLIRGFGLGMYQCPKQLVSDLLSLSLPCSAIGEDCAGGGS